MTTPKIVRASALVLFAVSTLLFVRWIPDDSFISFKYANNLAAGHGLVFNAGERVEGFSNLLWTLVLAGAARTGIDTVRAAWLLSLVCALASVWLSFGLFDAALRASDARRRVWLTAAFGLASIASFPMIFYATSGLETHAELMLLLLGVTLHLKAVATRSAGLFVPSTAAFLGVALIRPEGVCFLALNAGFVLSRRRIVRARVLTAAVVVSFVLYFLVILLKAGYYHSFVPNTYLAKPGMSFSYLTPFQRGFFYLVRFFLVSGLFLLLPFCIFALFKSRARYTVAFLSAVVVVQLAFILFVGGDVLRFDRFSVPFLPFLLALALMGAAEIPRTRPAALAVLVSVGALVFLNGERIHRALNKQCYHDWMHAGSHRQIGYLLADLLPQRSSVVVNEVGAISYYSGLKLIDMIGLTEAAVGRLIYESYQRFGVSGSEWSSPRIADHLLSQRPTCVIVPAYGEIDPAAPAPPRGLMHPIWAAVYEHPALKTLYRCVFSARIHDGKFLYFFFRNDVDFDPARIENFPAVDCLSFRRCPAT